MKFNPFLAAAALSLVLALGLVARIYSQFTSFRGVVNESLATSEGYDSRFIDLVNHLEDVLTTRASFPYPGGKDPMTGRRREVAAFVPLQDSVPRRPVRIARAVARPAPAEPGPAPDKVRLTAIIADDYGQHTAIVMDGERSLSVDVGDAVGGRRVVRISAKEVAMEDQAMVYIYSLTGARSQQRK